jgi:hypothetical protein
MFKRMLQLRRSLGFERNGLTDFALPALGLLTIGLLAGAGIALLVAPMTGQRLRAEMERKFGELRSRLILPPSSGSEPAARNNMMQGNESASHA